MEEILPLVHIDHRVEERGVEGAEGGDHVVESALHHIGGRPLQQIGGRPLQQIRGRPLKQIRGRPLQQIRGRPLQQIRGRPLQQLGEVGGRPLWHWHVVAVLCARGRLLRCAATEQGATARVVRRLRLRTSRGSKGEEDADLAAVGDRHRVRHLVRRHLSRRDLGRHHIGRRDGACCRRRGVRL